MTFSNIFIIYGPTAIGKSYIAYNLACEYNGIIISADSMQVFRGMDIGTSKASILERRNVRHFMIDICEPDESFSAGEFVEKSLDIINKYKDKNIFIVGGTALYIYSLINGIHKFPKIPYKIERKVNSMDKYELDNMLSVLDPDIKKVFNFNDMKRRKRALSVSLTLKIPYSNWINRDYDLKLSGDFKMVILNGERDLIYKRIEHRTENMLLNGWIDEVKGLVKKGYSDSCYGFRTAIGYREIVEYLKGKINYNDLKTQIKKKTRNYAKKQITWFNKFSNYAKMIDVFKNNNVIDAVRKYFNL